MIAEPMPVPWVNTMIDRGPFAAPYVTSAMPQSIRAVEGNDRVTQVTLHESIHIDVDPRLIQVCHESRQNGAGR